MGIRIALVLALLPTFPAWVQSTVTKAQLRGQDQRKTERQLKDQLWGIFEPVDERRRKGRPAPERPLDSSWLRSRSYAAPVPGLCRIDSVTLRFAPVEEAPHTARAAVRAYGLDAVAWYHFRKPPKGWHIDIADDERSPWDPQCAGLDQRELNFFDAPSDWIATDGYYAMLLAAGASASGKIKPRCNSMGFENKPCEKLAADFGAGAITSVERCEPVPSDICYKITDGWDRQMRVELDSKGNVQAIALEALIVLRHERID